MFQPHSECVVATSRVGAGVDGQILGYSPQNLLLGLAAIFTLQQLLVRVGQPKLCRAEEKRKKLLDLSGSRWRRLSPLCHLVILLDNLSAV